MPADEAILVKYLRRSYHAVDGLWFLKVEEGTDFERALEVDRQVWEILAKIQAREARRLLGVEGNSPEELRRCLNLKFGADGHDFEVDLDAEGLTVVIRGCPWRELLAKSKREHLGPRIAEAICTTEGEVWCQEFGDVYEFGIPEMGCAGAEECVMRFRFKVGPGAPAARKQR
jgi:hypothetical protein